MKTNYSCIGGFVIALAGILPGPATAENIYIAQTAQGTNDGSSAANAHAAVWFNTSANWGAGADKINAGDTARLCGTISTALIVQTAGTDGNTITIMFEPGARLSAPCWGTDGALYVNQKDYITVDGGTNGIIENTDNGTDLGNRRASSGIHMRGSNHFTVRDLLIRNMYIHTGATDETLSVNGCKGIWADAYDGSVRNYTNLLIQDNVIHDATAGIVVGYAAAGTRNVTICGNDIYNCNFGIQGGENDSLSYAEHWYIHHNKFHDWGCWDTDNNAYHHNGIYIWSTKATSHLDDVHIYNNTFGPGFTFHNTAGLFMGANYTSAYVYNNLFVLAAADDGPMNGLLYGSPNSKCPLTMVQRYFNNTFIGIDKNKSPITCSFGQSAGAGSQYIVENNLVYNFQYGVGRSYAGSPDHMPLTVDHNLYYRTGGVQFTYSVDGVGHFFSWTGWQGLGFDSTGSGSIYGSDPLLDSSYHLQAASPARNAGINLSQYFTTDFNGNPRPATGAWDIGAYGYTPVMVAVRGHRVLDHPVLSNDFTNPLNLNNAQRQLRAGSIKLYNLSGKVVPTAGLHKAGMYLVRPVKSNQCKKVFITK